MPEKAETLGASRRGRGDVDGKLCVRAAGSWGEAGNDSHQRSVLWIGVPTHSKQITEKPAGSREGDDHKQLSKIQSALTFDGRPPRPAVPDRRSVRFTQNQLPFGPLSTQ